MNADDTPAVPVHSRDRVARCMSIDRARAVPRLCADGRWAAYDRPRVSRRIHVANRSLDANDDGSPASGEQGRTHGAETPGTGLATSPATSVRVRADRGLASCGGGSDYVGPSGPGKPFYYQAIQYQFDQGDCEGLQSIIEGWT
jgi:hypothetical protein